MRHSFAFSRRHSAFTLMEVLIAIGLFALGFAAVASIFPAGALLQKNAAIETHSRIAADSAEATLRAMKLKVADLTSWHPSLSPPAAESMLLEEFPQAQLSSAARWPEAFRSFPTTTPLEERLYYWVPLFRTRTTSPTSAADWEVYVFVLRRELTGVYAYDTNEPASAYPRYDGGSGARSHLSIPCLIRATDAKRSSSADVITFTYNTNEDDILQPGDPILLCERSATENRSTFRTTVRRIRKITTSPADWEITFYGSLPANWEGDLWFAPAPNGKSASSAVVILGPLLNAVED